jgi:hypothetical protein
LIGQKAPSILEDLQKLSQEVNEKMAPIHSDDINSDSSNNQSENDEINQIVEIQKLHKQIEYHKQ